jgi:hypothetical protein
MLFFRSLIFLSFPIFASLSGCDAAPECDSFETRNAVLKAVSDDHNNALVAYAAKHSTPQGASSRESSETDKPSNSENTKPFYRLEDEKIVTTSTSKDKRTLKCTGSISVTVGDTKASKQIDFTVQQLPDGKLSVSVAPFQF